MQLLDTASPPPSAAKSAARDQTAAPKSPTIRPQSHERFIPVSRHGLRAKLIAMLAESGGDQRAWGRALDCLSAWRHQEHRRRLLDLIEDYLPFSPDSDTANLIELDARGRDKARAECIAGIERMLAQANFVRLSRDDVQRLLAERSPYALNLNVDLSEFDDALLYYRGTGVIVREQRNPWRFYLRTDRLEVPIFERLFLLLKLKPAETRIAEIMMSTRVDRARATRALEKARAHFPPGVSSDFIYVKIFKRIPQIDIEMLFPNTKVAFRPFDKLKLMVTAGGGTVAGVAGTATKLLAATNPFTLAFGVFGLSAVIFRQAMKFFHTRNHYMMVLAQSLYFSSLANNRGALTLIADGAEEEDVKEDMLLYAFLARNAAGHDSLPELKRDVTSFLEERCGVGVNFDVEETLKRLQSDGLVTVDAHGRFSAIAPEDARAHLDRQWDRLLDVDGLDRQASGP